VPGLDYGIYDVDSCGMRGGEVSQTDQFAMVYESILDSSIADDYEVRHFFEDMLKLADWRTGIVDRTPEAIHRRINLPLEKVRELLNRLEQPDTKDRSGNEEGRRIIRLDEHRSWGWTIVNYQCYRATRSAEERREYNRTKQAECRARKKEENGKNDVTPEALPNVTKRYTFTPPTLEEVKLLMAKSGLPDIEAVKFIDHHASKGWKIGRTQTPMRSVSHAVGTWKTNYETFREHTDNKSPAKSGAQKSIDRDIADLDKIIKG